MKAVISCSIRGAITRFAHRHTTPSVIAARCMSVSTDPHQIAFTKPVVSIDRKTKIVCTVGPATDSKPMIMSLLQAGMNVMRLNCSHGNEAYYRDVIGKLRTCLKEVRKESAVHGVDFSDGAREDVCAIALDTKGPEIRTGSYSSSMGREISIEAGAKITFSTNEEVKDNQSETCLYIDYPNIVNVLKVGSPIFVDDGLLRLQVESIDKESGLLNCLAKNSALLGEKKGVNLPGAKVTLPAVSEKDKLDIELAKTLGVDFIFASFVRKASHIAEIRKIVGDSISIIAKIENEEGLRNVESIIDAADGVMVARGDLGIEIPIQNVFLAQKRIMSLCNAKGKPVICATQMLESMVKSPRPTRAECSDVANAVLDGADCVMLSGETAKGLYPIEAVKLMSTICKTAECVIDYRQTCDDMRHRTKSPNQTSEALVLSAVVASFDEQAKVIIILGNTGHTAVLAAKYRPAAPIICVTSNSRTARRLQTARGVHAVVVPAGMVGSADMTTAAFKAALQMKVCKAGDRVVVIYSEFKGVTSTEATANVMKLTSVPTWMDDSTYLDE